MPQPALLRLEGVSKSFGDQPVLKGLNLDVARAEFLTLLGPSGCGKTTTLRLIAGFEQPDSGRLLLDGRDMAGLPPYQRDVHTVFQHYALFPHYDVFENVAFGLRVRKTAESETTARVREALALVKLSGFERRRIASLSGGQMQRIALARALVGRPALLLLDEPLGALDLKLRKEMQLELKGLQRTLGIAFVYVTHDQEEAMAMSDRIAVFNHGAIEQLGVPSDIYERPRTAFVAGFVGAANVLTALEAKALFANAATAVAIRPERIAVRYHDNGNPGGAVRLKASLLDNVFLGGSSQIFAKAPLGKTILAVSTDSEHRQRRHPGCPVWLDIHPKDIVALDA